MRGKSGIERIPHQHAGPVPRETSARFAPPPQSRL